MNRFQWRLEWSGTVILAHPCLKSELLWVVQFLVELLSKRLDITANRITTGHRSTSGWFYAELKSFYSWQPLKYIVSIFDCHALWPIVMYIAVVKICTAKKKLFLFVFYKHFIFICICPVTSKTCGDIEKTQIMRPVCVCKYYPHLWIGTRNIHRDRN